MPDHPQPKKAARSPQRSNGVKRREAIIKAASDIMSEAGVAGLTLHAAARRAKSSIGSMYHFFSDKDQLVEALRERHRQEMHAMLVTGLNTSQAAWQAMQADAVIGALFGQPITYYFNNPYAVQLHQLRGEQASNAFMMLLETVMKWRLGAERGLPTAQMLYAISTGTLAFIMDIEDTTQRALVQNIPSVLTAYLIEQEAQMG